MKADRSASCASKMPFMQAQFSFVTNIISKLFFNVKANLLKLPALTHGESSVSLRRERKPRRSGIPFKTRAGLHHGGVLRRRVKALKILS